MIAEHKHAGTDDRGLRHACDELVRRVRAGEIKVAERLAAAYPDLWADAETALELIYREFTLRTELGQKIDRDEYFGRFPTFHDRLARIFDLHALVGTGPSFADGTVVAESARTPAAALASGRPVGNYTLLEEIGRGGMGVVYKAHQADLNRTVAIKVILAGRYASAAQRARFFEEARTAARLTDPHIVHIHEVGEHEGLPFLSMEYIEGGNLEQFLAARAQQGRAALPPHEATRLVETLARTIHAAHQQGVVHRDLKPANILLARRQESGVRCQESGVRGQESGIVSPDSCPLTPDSCPLTPKLTDFGLAKTLDGGAATQTGQLLGTPAYMAPEQAAGARVLGPTIDVHALGVIMYELLTGRPPFEGSRLEETLDQVRHAEPVSPRQLRPHLPRDLETICLKCLRKEPAQRYATAALLAEDLARFQSGQPIQARPISVAERLAKWVRRQPRVAALLAVIFIVAAGSFAAITWQWRQTESARQAEEKQRQELETTLASKLILLARLEWMREQFDNAKQMLHDCPSEYRNDEWRYLHWACHAEVGSVKIPQQQVNRLVCSPDGRYFASVAASVRPNVSIHDSRNGEILFQLGPVEEVIQALSFSSDGQKLVVLAKPHIGIEKLARLKGLDKLAVLRAGWVHGITVWDVASQQQLLVRTIPRKVPGKSSLGAGAQRVAFALGADIWIWNFMTGQEVKLNREGYDGFGEVCLSPDGRYLAAAINNSILVWEVATQKVVYDVTADLPVLSLKFSPDGSSLAWRNHWSVEAKTQIVIWDLRLGRQTAVLRIADQVANIEFSVDGRLLALAGKDRTIGLWDVLSGQQIMIFRGHPVSVTHVAFHPDGTRLYSADLDNTIKIWRLTPPQIL